MEAETRREPGTFGGAPTPEMRERAAATRKRKSEERKASTLKADFGNELDAKWLEFAKRRGVRLPQYGIPCTVRQMRSWLGKIGWTIEDYEAWAGETDLSLFIKRNPTWPLRAFVGLILEEVEPWDAPKGLPMARCSLGESA